MSPIGEVTLVPTLVWDRIDENNRRTRNLLTFFALLLVPFTLALIPIATYAVYYAAPGLVTDYAAWMRDAVIAFLAMLGGACWIGLSRYHSSGDTIFRRAGAVPAGEREAELRRAVENLCIGAGLPVPGVHVIETLAPNAFTAGIKQDEAQIGVTRGLLELLDRRELEGVLAHEISHIGNGDVRLGSVLAGCLAVLRTPLDALRFVATMAGESLGEEKEGLHDSEAVAAQVMVMVIVSAVIGLGVGVFMFFDLLATLAYLPLRGEWAGVLRGEMAAGLSVKFFLATAAAGPAFLIFGGRILGGLAGRSVLEGRELLADAEAFALTRDAEALACALAKIDAVGAATPGSDPANAHLFVADPIRRKARWCDAPVMAHPPVEDRIAALQSLAAFPPESLERARDLARQWAKEIERRANETPLRELRQTESAELIPVYETADGWSPVVARVADKVVLTVLDSTGSGNFSKVRTPDGVVGYVSRQGPTHQRPVSPIRLYEAPDGWSRLIAEVPADTVLKPIDTSQSGNFVRVRTPAGTTGYVAIGRLQPTPVDAET